MTMSTKSQRLDMRISPDLLERLQDAAEQRGCTVSDIIRDAVSAELERACRRCHGTGREPS